MSLFNIGERVENASGQSGTVVGIADAGIGQAIKVERPDGSRTGWEWSSTFRPEDAA